MFVLDSSSYETFMWLIKNSSSRKLQKPPHKDNIKSLKEGDAQALDHPVCLAEEKYGISCLQNH